MMGGVLLTVVVCSPFVAYVYYRMRGDYRANQRANVAYRAQEAAFPGTLRCSYVGGANLALIPGAVYRLQNNQVGLAVLTPAGEQATLIPYANLVECTPAGRGHVQSGGGFIGGGTIGAGMVGGMLLAGALNSASTSSSLESVLTVVAHGAEGKFRLLNSTPAQVDVWLAPVRVAIRSCQSVIPQMRAPMPPPPMVAAHAAAITRPPAPLLPPPPPLTNPSPRS